IPYRAVLEKDLFPEMRVRAGLDPLPNVLELPAGPTKLFVAPTGRGKSVFARLLALDRAADGCPVALAVPDIKAALREAHHLELAATILGLNIKIVPLNSPSSSFRTASEVLEDSPAHDPAGAWTLSKLGYFCRLSAYAVGEPPRPGDEPCGGL